VLLAGTAIFGSPYLGKTTVDPAGDFYVYTAYNTGGINFGNKSQVISGNRDQTVAASGNPSLLVYNGDLYLFYNDAYGNANYVYTSDGINWSQVYSYAAGYFVDASQSAVVFNGLIYVGSRYHTDFSLLLTSINSANSYTTVNYPSIGLNFNPGLAVFLNTLFIAFETDANSHNLYYYESTNGTALTGPLTGTATNQSSTAPTLAVFNDVLYLGFRSNDSSNNFLYMYSTDGGTWSSSIEPHVGIGGNPELVVAEDLPPPYNGDIFFLWASESSPNFYLCSMHAPVP
jgi:hypothetical protein